jgi:hypothetical protein
MGARHLPFVVLMSVAGPLDLVASPSRANVELSVAPVQQTTHVWCWLAVGEMIFRAFDVPALNDHFQCGIVGAVAIGTARDVCARDCRRCTVPGGDAATVMNMLVEYPRRVSMLSGVSVPRLFVSHAGVLQPGELRAELDAGRPVVVGINPGGRPATFAPAAHVALVIGYRVVGDELWVLVNDPYPFSPQTWPDPYLAINAATPTPGRYVLPYRRLLEGLSWTESFLIRRDGMHEADAMRCLASTPLSHVACSARPTQAPGEPCACGLARGVVVEGGRP